jgi:hypothetical protein
VPERPHVLGVGGRGSQPGKDDPPDERCRVLVQQIAEPLFRHARVERSRKGQEQRIYAPIYRASPTRMNPAQ